MPTRFCDLQFALGRVERCPENERCPYWAGGECVIEPLRPYFDKSSTFAEQFLRVRGELEGSRPGAIVPRPPGF